MCILCVISRWSRRIVAMLPWLVIPFIITWAFSQLLPPDYRLEVTSTRLACLGVLLSSLGWYELLMPWLSSWRARRNALMRERKLIEAQEAAKWRKEATRRCRNCLTPYKVQTPGGGKFMCTYCGHVSKRPVLEVPLHSSANGVTLLTGKVPVRNETAGCWSKMSDGSGCAWFCDSVTRGETCRPWQYIVYVLSALGNIFALGRCIWIKVAGTGRLGAENSQGSQKLNNESDNSYASRSEKARKKANEKRQARLEKEMLEAEERKQREDVARLVEERRRQREEKLQAERKIESEAVAEVERESKRVSETGRCRKEKAVRERVQSQKQATNMEESMVSTTSDIQDSCTKQIPKFTSASKPAEALKLIRMTKSLKNQQGSKSNCFTNNMTKMDFQIHSGSVKQGPIPTSRIGCEKTGSWPSRKIQTGVDILESSPSGNVITTTSTAGETRPPDSVWKKAPWANPWMRQSNDNASGIQTGQNSKDKILEENANNSSKRSVLSPIGASATQQPIAPPSNHPTSLHQLFSSPTIFPPLDLPADHHEQTQRAEIKTSYPPKCTFFEPSAFQSSNSVPGLCSPSSPLHSKLMSDGGQPKTCESKYNAVSPGSVSMADTKAYDISNSSPISNSTKLNQLDLTSEKDGILAWDISSVVGINDIKGAEHGTLGVQLNQKKLLEQLEYEENLYPLQLTHLSTVQSLFDSEIILPESLSLSPQKEESLSLYGDYIGSAPQVLDRKSLWSDMSAFNAAVRIWEEDADSNQKLPPEFVDCITQEIMHDPVITADGHSYERTAIEKWLMYHDTSPKTGEVLPPPPGGVGVDKTLRPNHILRGQIIEYKEKLAKMQLAEVSWSSTSKDDNFVSAHGSLSVLSF